MSNELRSIRIWVDISWWDEVIYKTPKKSQGLFQKQQSKIVLKEEIDWVQERTMWLLKFLEDSSKDVEGYKNLNIVVYTQTIETLEKVLGILLDKWSTKIVSNENENKIKLSVFSDRENIELVNLKEEDFARYINWVIVNLNNKDLDIDTILSAWNTEYLVNESFKVLGRVVDDEIWKSIPALMSFFPKITEGETAVLDLWAYIWERPKSECLLNFAILATRYFDNIKQDSTLSLLNIWSERTKWWKEMQKAYDFLEKKFWGRFLWNIEGDNILTCKSDIIVTDWFTWNVALKVLEWAVKNNFYLIKEAVINAWSIKKALSFFTLSFLKKIKEKFNPDKYAWAPILWLNWLVFKTHWNSNSDSFYYALMKISNFFKKDKKKEDWDKEKNIK